MSYTGEPEFRPQGGSNMHHHPATCQSGKRTKEQIRRGGVHELTRPFELAAQDSGTADAPIVYRAHKGEGVRLAGGPLIQRPLTRIQVDDSAPEAESRTRSSWRPSTNRA